MTMVCRAPPFLHSFRNRLSGQSAALRPSHTKARLCAAAVSSALTGKIRGLPLTRMNSLYAHYILVGSSMLLPGRQAIEDAIA